MASNPVESENEDDFEETYVYVEMSGLNDENILKNLNSDCKVLGLDTDKPVFEIGGEIFTGNYKDVLGTCLIFDEDEDKLKEGGGVEVIQSETDPDKKVHVPPLRYKYSIDKRVQLFRGFLAEKDDETNPAEDTNLESADEEQEDIEGAMETVEDDDCVEVEPPASAGDATEEEMPVDQT